jgi:hypothetical protein
MIPRKAVWQQAFSERNCDGFCCNQLWQVGGRAARSMMTDPYNEERHGWMAQP